MPYPREFIAVPIQGGEWQVRLHPSGTTIEDPGATHLPQGDEPRILVLTVWPGQRPPICRLLAWRGGAYVDEPISPGVCQAWLTLLNRLGQLCLDPARCEGVLQTIPRDMSLPLDLISSRCMGQLVSFTCWRNNALTTSSCRTRWRACQAREPLRPDFGTPPDAQGKRLPLRNRPETNGGSPSSTGTSGMMNRSWKEHSNRTPTG